MLLKKHSQNTEPEATHQTCSETETHTGIPTAEPACAETDAELDAWVKKMLQKLEEIDRKNPGSYKHQMEFWQEHGLDRMFG